MTEINLMDTYPKVNRDVKKRLAEKTPAMIDVCKQFGWEFFDKKGYCYNGYFYDGRWIPIAKRFIEYYNLKPGAKILDIGCAKGYFVYDLRNLGMDAYGLDVSEYAIRCCPPEIMPYVLQRDVRTMYQLVYDDNEFDLVTAISVVETLREPECREVIREIQRIGKNAFLKVDAWRNEEEKQRMIDWGITGITMMSTDDWKQLFKEEGYKGDYYWFIP